MKNVWELFPHDIALTEKDLNISKIYKSKIYIEINEIKTSILNFCSVL